MPRRHASRRGRRASAHHTANRQEQFQESAIHDRALYGCGCGLVFEADVSTSVECPHCGEMQAW
jgi:hypothetical protein